MVKAVIFDWFGTLAEWEHRGKSNYLTVLAGFGYEVDAGVIDAYHARWDGVDHREHSVSQDAYVAWTRGRLAALVRECGVADAEAERVVEAFVESDYGAPMLAYPEAVPTLRALRDRGLSIAICSNWGWDIETFLEATGIAPLVDVAVTSARAGFRKPHRGIYELVLGAVGAGPAEALFVGDSWGPDVLGPTAMGMAAVHVIRGSPRPGPALLPNQLLPNVARVSSLDELLGMDVLALQ